MNEKSPVVAYRSRIGLFEFLVKLLVLLARLPSLAYNLIKGLRMIKGNRNLSWGSVLEDVARKYPNNAAIKSPDGILTYRELNETANRYAHFLLSRKIGKDDVVAVCLENRPELLVVYCACAKIGARCSMINTNQRGESLVHSFNLNKGKVVIVGEECFGFFSEARNAIDLAGSEVYLLRDRGAMAMPPAEDMTSLAAAMSAENPDSTGAVTLKDTAAYVYTSGTTGGLPKAAVIINRRIVSAMFWFGRVVTRVRPGDTVYIPLPFFHTNALTVGWPAALYNGAAVALRRKFSASQFLEDARRFNTTHFVYVGEVCRYLMALPEKPDDSANPLRAVIGNGLRPDIWKAFKKRFGIRKVHEFYGAAEGVGVFTNIMNFDCSVGTSLTPYAIVKYDTESDAPERDANGFLKRVGRGEAGLLIMEISERTPFPGYTDKKKSEEKVIRDAFRKGDLWFNTGDMLRNMGFRHAQFVDRLGDTFRWKGENVATMEVEKALDSFPGVDSSAVYGVSMPSGDGKAGMAAIIKDRGADCDLASLAAHLKSSLPKYAVPIFMRFVDDFQWTATHKIKKTDLKTGGYDPALVQGQVYVLLPEGNAYVPMDDALYRDIRAGKYRF